MSRYRFEAMRAEHLPLVSRWRARPHVRRWWGESDVEPERGKLAHPDIAALIVSLDRRPFAFLQDYRVHAWDPHPFAYLPPGSRGIDLYIGEADLIGQGHGGALVRQFLTDRFAAGVPAIGVDPHPDNLPARRAFEKAGFTTVSGPVDTPWGRAVLMECRA